VSPVAKYTLGRVGLFLACLVALLPVRMNILLKLMLAIIVSAALALFLLRKWRDEMAAHLSEVGRRRAEEKERLRDALAGDGTALDAAPAAKGVPVVEDAPAVEGAPAADDAPAAKGVPVVEDAPAVEGAPAADDDPAARDAPASKDASRRPDGTG